MENKKNNNINNNKLTPEKIEELSNILEQTENAEDVKAILLKYNDEIVNIILNKYKKEITTDITPAIKPKLYVVGGQNASGKSYLVRRLGKKEPNKANIIIDDMKAHHPFREIIDTKFPEDSENLLHIACFDVFDKLLDNLLKENYNILIERTLGNAKQAKSFVKLAFKHNYDVDIHVTATHELNSLMSALERFVYECELKDKFLDKKSSLKIEPRPITIGHHDKTYENIKDVLTCIEKLHTCKIFKKFKKPNISIYDRTPKNPTLIYSTDNKRIYTCVKNAIKAGRENDLERCFSINEFTIPKRLDIIKDKLKQSQLIREQDIKNTHLPTLSEPTFQEFCQEFITEIEKRYEKCINHENNNSELAYK